MKRFLLLLTLTLGFLGVSEKAEGQETQEENGTANKETITIPYKEGANMPDLPHTWDYYKDIDQWWMTYVPENDLLVDETVTEQGVNFYIMTEVKIENPWATPKRTMLCEVKRVAKNLPVLIRIKNKNSQGIEITPAKKVEVLYDTSKRAKAEDGKYILDGITYTNYLHYYEEATEVPDADTQERESTYYYGLAKDDFDDAEWRQITSGHFKARKAFLKTTEKLSYSEYSDDDDAKDLFVVDETFSFPEVDDMQTEEPSGEDDDTGDDATTAISLPTVAVGQDAVYTIQGQRMGTGTTMLKALPKGIYLYQGKKYIVK